jgi:TPR repeat protein
MRHLVLGLILFVCGISAFCSGDDKLLQDAKAAYERGDYTTAFSKFKMLADQKNPMAQYVVGSMYEKGDGVREDDAEAEHWFRLSAAQGYAFAQDKLGVMHYAGEHELPKDYAAAARWFGLAVAQGLASAQRNLGTMYVLGDGVPQDYKEAMRLFQLAAFQGDATANFDIGQLYFSGHGVSLDMALALKWYLSAAELGKLKLNIT